jgi:C4-dicarboxylate-specific signal transduction histidine kinase
MPRFVLPSPVLLATAALVGAAVFVLDTITEHGIAVAVLYVAVVLIVLRVLAKTTVLLVSAACIGLTVLSYWLTRGDPSTVVGLVNCGVSIAAILAVTYLGLQNEAAGHALQHARTELAHMQRVTALGELTASIVHQVNQPIAGTVTNADAALHWLAADPPDLKEARQALEGIVEDSKRTSEIVSRIRALVQKTPPRREPLDMNELIRGMIALIYGDMQRSGISLHPEFAPNLALVRGDRVQLQQILLNLILNAIDAMADVTSRSHELRISTQARADDMVVAVQDSGIGLGADTESRLFEAFYSTKPGGMGMGLSICRSIVEAHGGRIWATANSGSGATVQFSLPLPSGGM